MEFNINNLDSMTDREREIALYHSTACEKHSVPSKETKKQLKLIQEKMDNHVTKDLFEAKMDGLAELINEKFKTNGTEHGKLDIRVATTNGRVKRLEIWKAFLFGAWAVVSIGFPMLFIFFMNDLRGSVHMQIEEEISKYIELTDE